jgi:hypothetical protein
MYSIQTAGVYVLFEWYRRITSYWRREWCCRNVSDCTTLFLTLLQMITLVLTLPTQILSSPKITLGKLQCLPFYSVLFRVASISTLGPLLH